MTTLVRDWHTKTEWKAILRLSVGFALVGLDRCNFMPKRAPESMTSNDNMKSRTGLLTSIVAIIFCSAGVAEIAEAQDETFLKPDEAFVFTVGDVETNTLTLGWRIAPGYYLYKDRFEFTVNGIPLALDRVTFPRGEWHEDEYFGEMEVFRDVLTVGVPIHPPPDSQSRLDISIVYQGCADAGLCYNPISKSLQIDRSAGEPRGVESLGPGLIANATSVSSQAVSAPATTSTDKTSTQDDLAALIVNGKLVAVLGTFFAAGLLLSLTPCVLPMIPILSGIIIGQGKETTAIRGFALAFIYVQGMALTYAAAAVVFVLAFNQAPQAFFQQPWIIAAFAGLFVILALAMFGTFSIELPGRLQTLLATASQRQKSGTFVGTFVMGALSALIVTACVAPALIAALSVIAQTGLIARSAVALYVMGLGMGVPLLIVGASAGSLLPKAGPWMNAVKSLFGIVFIGVAIYLASSLLPESVSMTLWAVLAMVSGYWLFSLREDRNTSAPALLPGMGLVFFAYGVLLLVGASTGATDPLRPLQRFSTGIPDARINTQAAHTMLPFRSIKTIGDFESELALAVSANRPLMLDFYADWCVSCKEMEKHTFSDPEVQQLMDSIVVVQADVTANDASDQELLRRFGIFGPPTIAFFSASGKELENYRVVGYMSPDEFGEHLATVLGEVMY